MQSDNRFVGAVEGMAAPGSGNSSRAVSPRAEDLRVTFAAWMRCREESAEVLMAAQPIIRATVASVLGNRVDLRDEAESMALEYVWKHLKDCRSDIVAWVRYIAKAQSLLAIQNSARSSAFASLDESFIEYRERPSRANLNRLLLLVRESVFSRTRDEDIAQALVVYLIDNASKITPRSTFSRWLSGAIRNQRTNHYRSLQAKHIYENSLDEDRLPVERDYEPDFPRNLEALARDLKVGSAERVLVESMLDGETLRQAAKSIGIAETAARNRLRRLGRKLERQGKTYAQK